MELCYTTCNGQTVSVKPLGYASPKYFHQYRVSEPIPAKVERMKTAWGGGMITEWSYLIGSCACGQAHFVERRIERPSISRDHKCDARCQNARGRKCECSCRGKNHGSN